MEIETLGQNQPTNKKPFKSIVALIVLGLFLALLSFYVTSLLTHKPTGPSDVLGMTYPESLLSMQAPGIEIDTSGNYKFPLGNVNVLLYFATGAANPVDTVEAIVHYDPRVISARGVDFNHTLSNQYFRFDAMRCNPVYIQKDAAGNETGTLKIVRTAIPLPTVCPPTLPADEPLGTVFPQYTPMPINQAGPLAQVNFVTLQNTTTPYLITYEFRTSFPNPVDILNDSNAPAYVAPGSRTGTAYDTLSGASNLSFVVNPPTPPADTTPPTVNITNPSDSANVSGGVNIVASATDNVGVSGVEILVDGTRVCLSSAAPYACNWNSTNVANGSRHTVVAKAYDTATIPNTALDTITVSVCNGDCQAPTAPTSLTSSNVRSDNVTLSWTASTDNVGVAGYYIYRRKNTENTYSYSVDLPGQNVTYNDSSVEANTGYSYQIKAYDAARNFSPVSNTITVTTPSAPVIDTTAPSAPTGLIGRAVSTTQINLNWNASTDNVGVSGYNVYRSTTGSFAKINSSLVTSINYGNGSLTSSTTYNYYVTAVDAAGNESQPSATINVRTLDQVVSSAKITGTVTDAATGKPITNGLVGYIINNRIITAGTTSRGTYTISNVPPGTYTMYFYKAGYTAQTHQITVVSGQTYVLNARLVKK